MNIDELIRLHDKNQFEIKLGYLLDHKSKRTKYSINLYFFIPKNLGINKYTYTKNHFFEDFNSYIRLITPKETLQSLTIRLKNLINFLETNKLFIDRKFEFVNYEVKIIVCSYRAYLRDFSKVIKNGLCSDENHVKEFVDDIKLFRKEIKKLKNFVGFAKKEKLQELFLFADEYSSLITDVYLFSILNSKKNIKNIEVIKECIKSEINYRKKNQMSVVSNIDKKNEELIYKYSVFKKYFYNILFLSRKRKEDSTEYRQFFYAIAAGIAMIFATGVAFVFQKKYGNFTMPFFVALVVSYMLKDRIKDTFRQLFDNKWIFRKVYDFRNKIYDLERFNLLGFFKERVRFVKKETLPKTVVDIRLKNSDGHLSTWYLGEYILKYEKKIELYNDKIINSFDDKIEGINDIIRFNVSKFVNKMDDPNVPLYTIDKDIKKVIGSKVYHVNLVIEFQSDRKHYFYKVRLILTKNGIKRIEVPD